MKFKRIYDFELLRAGKTQNDLELNVDAVKEAVTRCMFDNAPIVLNEKESYKDYRDEEQNERYFRTKLIGLVLPYTVYFNGKSVFGDIMILEEFSDRTCYDNWCIKPKDSYFEYIHCELF